MSICAIENVEVGELSLYDLSVQPTYGMFGAGEPTERGAKRMLEKLELGEDGQGKRRKHFLQIGVIVDAPLPPLRVDAFLTASWKPNDECDMSCLSVVWLIDKLEDALSPNIKSLFNGLKWTDFAEEFVFN